MIRQIIRNNLSNKLRISLSKGNYDVHLEGYKHKNLQAFLENSKHSKVKEEHKSGHAVIVHVSDGPPEAKRPRLEGFSNNLNSEPEDKLEYLKYIEQLPNGNYKCGICGKTKLSRKFLLHHLKQHEEVPTFNCINCSERFVFKRKYDKHLQMHGNLGHIAEKEEINEDVGDNKELIVNEHPKFQENSKAMSNEIRCNICQIYFKLTIMLNKHKTTWHSDENPNKNLSMQEQKQKNKEGTVKLHRCNYCSDTYHKPDKLDEHIRISHNNKFVCNRCNLEFVEQQFLDNHQKLFCIHRLPSGREGKDTAKHTNEQ